MQPFGQKTPKERTSWGMSIKYQLNRVTTAICCRSSDKPGQPITPAFTNLPQGSTHPRGWIADMMKFDLQEGIVGALQDLYPGIKSDDLYRTARRGGLDDVPEMGDLILTGEPWEQSIMWWNAETIGNWWDGYVRHAHLTGDEDAIRQTKNIIDNLIASQDPDGYIGIYKDNLRYQHAGSNGELWAQTTAFRTMLGYYEITGDTQVLDAVERGMAVTMERYSPAARNPFDLKNAYGGVTHGLMMTDVCETLYRITGKSEYQVYATYLYRDFSTYDINRAFNDLRYPLLLERDSLFTGHGVHTYEHLRTLINAYYHTGYPKLQTAFEHALYKLNKAILPSGAGHGNEWLAGLEADATYTHTEYCTMLELRNSLSSMFQKTGDTKFADHAEKLTYNGMMGARDPNGKAITYGKGDNCYVLDGKYHGEAETHDDVRYKYSPTHSDPAVCCAPNYARNLPYFLDQMWVEAPDGLVAVMYGPSVVNTTYSGVELRIEQVTTYPFSDDIQFVIDIEQPTTFALYFRKPSWTSSEIASSTGDTVEDIGDFWKIEKEWSKGDMITISFEHDVLYSNHGEGEVYVQRGPLVYAFSIAHRIDVIKDYADSDFTDFHCYPIEQEFLQKALPDLASWDYQPATISPGSNPWKESFPRLKSNNLILEPMGSTVLRRVTFLASRD